MYSSFNTSQSPGSTPQTYFHIYYNSTYDKVSNHRKFDKDIFANQAFLQVFFYHLRCSAFCFIILPALLTTCAFCCKILQEKLMKRKCCILQNENRSTESGVSKYNQLAGFEITFLFCMNTKIFLWSYFEAKELITCKQKYCIYLKE